MYEIISQGASDIMATRQGVRDTVEICRNHEVLAAQAGRGTGRITDWLTDASGRTGKDRALEMTQYWTLTGTAP